MALLLLFLSALAASVVPNSLAAIAGGSGDYLPRHMYKEGCVARESPVSIERDGCVNNITLRSCIGACTGYEFPVVFKTRYEKVTIFSYYI